MRTQVNEFTYSEFIEYVERTRPVVPERASEKKDDTQWSGTPSFEQAIQYAKYGWEAGIAELAVELDMAVIGNTEVRHDIVGSSVDVGAFLSGSPECMVQYIDMQERERDEVVVYVQLGYNAGVEGPTALKFTKTLLRELVKLNQKYSLKLIGVISTYHSGSRLRTHEYITVKDTYQNLVLNNLAFAFHPSFFRRLWFRFLETKKYWATGYGQAVEEREAEKDISIQHAKIAPHAKHIYIPSVADVGPDWVITKKLNVKKK